MRRKTRALLTAAVLVAAALGWVRPLPAQNRWGANYFPNVTLTTQDGKQVKFYDDLLKGKTVGIYLMYTHCLDACPLETARLAQVQRILGDRVGKDIFFYALSIDPKRDTPEVLKAYAEKFHVAPPAWTFLTGKKEDIDLVAKKMGLYFDPGLNRDGHTVDLMIGDEPTGQWMKNSAVDNPRFLATLIGEFLSRGHYSKPRGNYTEAKSITMTDRGQHLYATQCGACHTIGHGDTIGPDLLGITKVRNRAWLARFIQVPEVMLQEGDPLATALFEKYKKIRMPNLQVDPEGAALLINFIERQSEREKSMAAPSQAPTDDQPASQPAKGGASLHHN